MRVGGARGGLDLGLARVGVAEAQVLLDACRGTGRCPAPTTAIMRRTSSGSSVRRSRPPMRTAPASADRAGAAAGARWWTCPSRWGRRCRRARPAATAKRIGRDAPDGGRRDRRSVTSSNAMLAMPARPPQPALSGATGAVTGASSSALMPDAADWPTMPWCSTVRRSRSGRKISVPGHQHDQQRLEAHLAVPDPPDAERQRQRGAERGAEIGDAARHHAERRAPRTCCPTARAPSRRACGR